MPSIITFKVPVQSNLISPQLSGARASRITRVRCFMPQTCTKALFNASAVVEFERPSGTL